MSFVLLHITWDWRQPNHLLTCVPGSQSHPGYLKLCLPGPVFYENSWESCHISRVPAKRQMKAARKVQLRFEYAMVLLALAGKKQWGPGGAWEMSGRACRAAVVTAQRLAFSWGRGGMWDGSHSISQLWKPLPFQHRVRRAGSEGTVGCLLEKQLWWFNKLLLDQLFVPAPLCWGAVTESVGSFRLLQGGGKQALLQVFAGTGSCHAWVAGAEIKS